jgi:transcriptional regulator with XRE-family HTH domain
MSVKLTAESAESNVRVHTKKGFMEKVLIYEALGGNIRRARSNREMRQTELARLVGLSRTSITNVELGRQGLAIHQLFEFAEALGVEPCELLPAEWPMNQKRADHLPPELSDWVASLKHKSRRL